MASKWYFSRFRASSKDTAPTPPQVGSDPVSAEGSAQTGSDEQTQPQDVRQNPGGDEVTTATTTESDTKKTEAARRHKRANELLISFVKEFQTSPVVRAKLLDPNRQLPAELPTVIRRLAEVVKEVKAREEHSLEGSVNIHKTTEFAQIAAHVLHRILHMPGSSDYRALGLNPAPTSEQISTHYQYLRQIFAIDDAADPIHSSLLRVTEAYVALRIPTLTGPSAEVPLEHAQQSSWESEHADAVGTRSLGEEGESGGDTPEAGLPMMTPGYDQTASQATKMRSRRSSVALSLIGAVAVISVLGVLFFAEESRDSDPTPVARGIPEIELAQPSTELDAENSREAETGGPEQKPDPGAIVASPIQDPDNVSGKTLADNAAVTELTDTLAQDGEFSQTGVGDERIETAERSTPSSQAENAETIAATAAAIPPATSAAKRESGIVPSEASQRDAKPPTANEHVALDDTATPSAALQATEKIAIITVPSANSAGERGRGNQRENSALSQRSLSANATTEPALTIPDSQTDPVAAVSAAEETEAIETRTPGSAQSDVTSARVGRSVSDADQALSEGSRPATPSINAGITTIVAAAGPQSAVPETIEPDAASEQARLATSSTSPSRSTVLAEKVQPQSAGLVVIGSPALRTNTLTQTQISDIFLGKASSLPSGETVTPIDQQSGNAMRDEFYTRVLGKSWFEVKAYRTKQLFTRSIRAPASFASDEAIKKQVLGSPGAIGYVSSAAVDDSVKILFTLDE